jgi:hypothetical protein
MGPGRIVGIALLALGIVLLYFGYSASQSVVDQASKTFFGQFTNQTMWLIIGGIVSAVVGLGLTIFGGGRARS